MRRAKGENFRVSHTFRDVAGNVYIPTSVTATDTDLPGGSPLALTVNQNGSEFSVDLNKADIGYGLVEFTDADTGLVISVTYEIVGSRLAQPWEIQELTEAVISRDSYTTTPAATYTKVLSLVHAAEDLFEGYTGHSFIQRVGTIRVLVCDNEPFRSYLRDVTDIRSVHDGDTELTASDFTLGLGHILPPSYDGTRYLTLRLEYGIDPAPAAIVEAFKTYVKHLVIEENSFLSDRIASSSNDGVSWSFVPNGMKRLTSLPDVNSVLLQYREGESSAW